MQRVNWKRLTTEPLQYGDMWASHDPNELGDNLLMSAVSEDAFGVSPDINDPRVNIGNGDYYRPVGFVVVKTFDGNDCKFV